MPLLGCFVTPHPPIIVPEVGGSELARVDATVVAMQKLMDETAGLDPETIVLLSPHATVSRSQMGVSLAHAYRGSFAYFRAPRVTLRAEADLELAKEIVDEASRHGIPTVVTATHETAADLDHGAMVPLYYLMKGLLKPCRLVLLSFSYLSLEEHLRFGRALGALLQASPKRIVYVASSDLSHRLTPDAPAGFNPRAAEFDRAVVETFSKGDWEALLSLDAGLVNAAGECGYRSLVVLAGIVEAITELGAKARNEVLSYEGPFGVGYLVGRVRVEQPVSTAEDSDGRLMGVGE
jgi:MEMO1 family protein